MESYGSGVELYPSSPPEKQHSLQPLLLETRDALETCNNLADEIISRLVGELTAECRPGSAPSSPGQIGNAFENRSSAERLRAKLQRIVERL